MGRLLSFLQINTTRKAWILLSGSFVMFLLGMHALHESAGAQGNGQLFFLFWLPVCGLYIALALWALFSVTGQRSLMRENGKIANVPRTLRWYAKCLFACFAAGFASFMLLGVLALPFDGYRVLSAMFQPNGGIYLLFFGFLWAPLIFKHIN